MVIEHGGNGELRFRNPGSLLVVVLGFLFWGVGLLDLLGHTSQYPDVFGLYSLPFFVFILLYASTGIVWFVLFLSPRALGAVTGLIRAVQRRTWLALLALAGLGLALWIILEWDRWLRLPGLQFAAFALTVLAGIVLIFSGWREYSKQQLWRKVVAYPLFALILVECIIQGLAFFGMLPGTHYIGGDFVPYARIYQNEEGFRNGVANRYGWTYPDSEIDLADRQVLLLGGSHLQALQVEPEEQVTARLAARLNQDAANRDAVEVIGIGLSGFGPSPYFNGEFLQEIIDLPTYDALIPDEMILLFHLGNDFQSAPSASNPIVHTVDDAGHIQVDPESAKLRHDVAHYFLRGYLSFQLVETARSHYLTPKVIQSLARGGLNQVQAAGSSDEFDLTRLRGVVTSFYALTEPGHAGIKSTRTEKLPGGNNFLFERTVTDAQQEALDVAAALIESSHQVLLSEGIPLRIVTIPAFPQAFYDHHEAGAWNSIVGEYDLFLPEQALQAVAQEQGIPILPLGQYMFDHGLSTDEIKALYFSEGRGHLTVQGHDYLAQAIHTCFFADAVQDVCKANEDSSR